MSKWSSRCCSVSFFLVIFASVGFAQEKNGEFKHELPDGVELVDPKSLGLTDADLSKFLGNVKVLGGGQVGDTKTQILTVGFEGDENINFNDFTIPGLTDGNNTALPDKDKEIADMAFKKFKEFFADPNKAKQFEQGGNHNINLGFPTPTKQEQNKHQLQVAPQKHPPHQQRPHQFHIPMIQKPYTTPRTPHIHFTTNHPARYVQPPPPPSPPQAHVVSPVPPVNNSPPPHVFNAQIKSQSPALEFGARIPTSPNPQIRHQPQAGPPQNFQNPPQNQFHHQQHHRLVPQQQQQQNHNQQQHQNRPQRPFQQIHQQQPPSHQHQTYLQQPPPPPQVQFIQHPTPTRHSSQQNVRQPFPPPPPRHQAQTPAPPPSPPQVPVPNFNRPQHPPTTLPNQHPPQQEQGRIVRNQLLMESNNHRFQNNGHFNNNHLQLRPPPPPSQSAHQSASNQVPVQTNVNPQFQNQLPSGAATATSHVYIQRGSKKSTTVQHTNFHPQFQPPTRMSKDFTPTLFQVTTTSRPTSFEVTPSMPLIPLSTNENAITDPTRMLQLRLYQQQKAQASNTQQSILPHQTPTSAPTIASTTTPISITTSYPEIDGNQQQFAPSANYEHQIGNQLNDNDIFNKGSFALQTQQQQHQLHILQQSSSSSPQSQSHNAQTHHPQQQQQHHHQPPQYQHLMQSHNNQLQPTVFYTQEHRRPPRQGPQNPHHPRFQFHMSHELGQPPRLHMNPDPKSLLNTIRRKRGYRRLSNLFNRMFRWDRH